ncbi:MAG: FAD-dependent oxidoreductase [Desulfobacterales bacterium]|nr:FAD-dependent oxidoreductase [Desulfobacterales bacterium]
MTLERLWSTPPLKQHYDVVIIGGGIHALATAYFLAKNHGITDVAVLERNHIGFGGACRNTAIVRANQHTQKNVNFYKEGLGMWQGLMEELDFNMMFHNCGILDVLHSEDDFAIARNSVSTAKFCGVQSEILDQKQVKELVPELNLSEDIRHPIIGGMYHSPGGILRHDGVVWGFAKGASRLGVHIHQQIDVEEILVENGRVAGVQTSQGKIHSPKVMINSGAYGNLLAYQLGIALPIHTLTIQACVTQPLKPFLHTIVASGAYWVYANQTLKGEIAAGAHMDPWPNYTTQTTPQYLKHLTRGLVEIMPCLKGVKYMRHWSGLADMTPDSAPIMEGNYPIGGLFMNVGWGYFGFKAGAVSGKYMAKYMAADQRPKVLENFSLGRFEQFESNGENPYAYAYGPNN